MVFTISSELFFKKDFQVELNFEFLVLKLLDLGGPFYKWSGWDCEYQYLILFFEQSYNEWALKSCAKWNNIFPPVITQARYTCLFTIIKNDTTGCPEATWIFEIARSQSENDILGTNWEFLLIWVWQYLLYLMVFHFFDVLLKYRV